MIHIDCGYQLTNAVVNLAEFSRAAGLGFFPVHTETLKHMENMQTSHKDSLN